MSRVKSQCRRCGHCCCVPLNVHPFRNEAKNNKFKIVYSKNYLAWILKKKLVYIPEFKKKRLVCYYYDPETRDCLIHDDKPKACKAFNCQEKPKKYIDTWYDWLKA